MFDKLTANMCPAAHVYWIVALITIAYKVVRRLSGILGRSLGGIVADGVMFMWDIFWVYIVTSGIKKMCEDGYEMFAYAVSAFFLILWFKDGMAPPVRLIVN
jgi:hypothetical protein